MSDDLKDGPRDQGPWIAFRTESWVRVAERLTPELEGMLVRILNRMIARDEPFPSDPDVARHLLKVGSRRKAQRTLSELENLGILKRVSNGFTFDFADEALAERRKLIARNREIARKRVSSKHASGLPHVRGKHEASSHPNMGGKTNEYNETQSPDAHLPNHTKKEDESPSYPTASSQDAARGKTSFDLRGVGLGRGGSVTVEGRRRVCSMLGIANADPLVALYEQWPRSRMARDADRLFAKAAPKIFREASREIRQACQPQVPLSPDSQSLPPAEPSHALRTKLKQEGRHVMRAH